MLRWFVPGMLLVLGGVGGMIAGPLLSQPTSTLAAVPRETTSYRDVVKRVLPAVVRIEVESAPISKAKQPSPKQRPRVDDPALRRFFDDSQVPEEFRKFFDRLPAPQFQFQFPDEAPHHGLGSGFIVDPKGVILTNHHVVKGAGRVTVRLNDGRQFISKDIKSDPKSDLAVVRIDANGSLPYLEMGDSGSMEIGDRVLAVGAPFGLTGSVTAGIVSAKGRNLHTNMYEDFLQTDAAINPGNSGGPLVNLEGKVIGINTAIKSRSGGSQGVGLAIASNLAKNVMDQLRKDGVVHRGYLGVQVSALEPAVAEHLGVANKQGVVVGKVFMGTPAAKASMQDGDIITTLAGKPVTDAANLQRVVAGLPVGRPVEVQVVRDGKSKTLTVTIEEQPREFGTAAGLPESPEREQEGISLNKLGVQLKDLTPDMAKQYGYKDMAKGVLIAQVDPDSLAAAADLHGGMLLLRVEQKTVHSAGEARRMLEKAPLEKGVLLQVQSSEDGVRYVVLKALGA
jgi:serine protease Do